MNVIFMGTPEFAVPTLEKLNESGYDIKLVVTQPDKPSGRGKKLKKSDVKIKAEELGFEVFQPDKIKSNENIEKLKSFNPDFIVVVAYGQILNEKILNIPKFGCINVHASLLPKFRGAAPLNWAIINGERITGVTTMLMDVGLDTGDMLLKSKIDITNDMNVGELHDKLMIVGADTLIETLKGIENNNIQVEKQDDALSNYAPMLNKENTKIKWNEKAHNIHNLIRGLSPWPSAYFIYDENKVKVYKSSYINGDPEANPGFVLKVNDEGIFVASIDGVVIIEEFQMPGKNKMSVSSFLRGNKFPDKITLE